MEKDLSLKRQRLDVVVLRKDEGEFLGRLPNGLDNLAQHNLITFKSYQETLDDWALKELTGHYVNYRKQASPSMHELLPEEAFRLYAVCARYPQQLARQVPWTELQPGVFKCRRGTDRIRVVVLRLLPASEPNALLQRLFEKYQGEGLNMPYTMADFRRDYVKEHLSDLTVEERLAGLSAQELAARLPVEERLAGLSPEQRLAELTAEQIEHLLKRLKQTDVPTEGPTGAA